MTCSAPPLADQLAAADGRRWRPLAALLTAGAILAGCHADPAAPPPALGRYACHSGLSLGAFTLLDRRRYTAYDPFRDETSAGEYDWTGDTIELRSGRNQGISLRWVTGHPTTGWFELLNAAGKPTGVTCSPER